MSFSFSKFVFLIGNEAGVSEAVASPSPKVGSFEHCTQNHGTLVVLIRTWHPERLEDENCFSEMPTKRAKVVKILAFWYGSAAIKRVFRSITFRVICHSASYF